MTITNDIKNVVDTVKPDSATEITHLLQSDHSKLKEAGEFEADSKLKMALLKNWGLNLIYQCVPFKKAANRIGENLSMLEPKTAESLSNKITRLVDVEVNFGSLPALATATEALVYAQGEPDLSELFENLIASSVDKAQDSNIHPAFVEILKQMSVDDARYFKNLIGRMTDSDNKLGLGLACVSFYQKLTKGRKLIEKYCLAPSDKFTSVPLISLENFERLKLISITEESFWVREGVYKYAQDAIKGANKEDGVQFEYDKGQLILTEFGKNFAKAIKILIL